MLHISRQPAHGSINLTQSKNEAAKGVLCRRQGEAAWDSRFSLRPRTMEWGSGSGLDVPAFLAPLQDQILATGESGSSSPRFLCSLLLSWQQLCDVVLSPLLPCVHTLRLNVGTPLAASGVPRRSPDGSACVRTAVSDSEDPLIKKKQKKKQAHRTFSEAPQAALGAQHV